MEARSRARAGRELSRRRQRGQRTARRTWLWDSIGFHRRPVRRHARSEPCERCSYERDVAEWSPAVRADPPGRSRLLGRGSARGAVLHEAWISLLCIACCGYGLAHTHPLTRLARACRPARADAPQKGRLARPPVPLPQVRPAAFVAGEINADQRTQQLLHQLCVERDERTVLSLVERPVTDLVNAPDLDRVNCASPSLHHSARARTDPADVAQSSMHSPSSSSFVRLDFLSAPADLVCSRPSAVSRDLVCAALPASLAERPLTFFAVRQAALHMKGREYNACVCVRSSERRHLLRRS